MQQSSTTDTHCYVYLPDKLLTSQRYVMLVVSDILTEPDIDPDTANYRCQAVTGALGVV